jgi:hypothetical protein
MSSKGKGRQKGKGLNISGIPLGGAGFSQEETPSAEPNREEPVNAFREVDDNDDSYARDYIRDESARLGPALGGYVANKADEQWSVGLEDEANEPEDLSDEGMLPEIQPLHIDPNSPGEDDSLDLMLRPDTIDSESEDLDEQLENEKGEKK